MRRRVLLSGALTAVALAACRAWGLEPKVGAYEDAATQQMGDSAAPAPGGCALDLALASRVDWASHFEPGVYRCAVCGQPLFESSAKFDPGTPWPSFYAAIEGAVAPAWDGQQGRISESAIECGRCGAHLGDVFRGVPSPTGLRYCIVSPALVFEPKP